MPAAPLRHPSRQQYLGPVPDHIAAPTWSRRQENEPLGRTLGDLFDTFHYEAFRLQTLDDYSNSGSVHAYRAFLDGRDKPADCNAEWLEEVRTHAEAGRRIRMHVVTRPGSNSVSALQVGSDHHRCLRRRQSRVHGCRRCGRYGGHGMASHPACGAEAAQGPLRPV
ncbi:DUF6879 family protein [Streptomyces massasporeus]|uniref:DUF6879 family protein n=1 Tax=Streptomyces massasporeus TaxID=67324 RepID=UPI00371B66DC